METKHLTIDAGIRYNLAKKLESKGLMITNVSIVHHGIHRLVTLSNKQKLYVVYKRALFNTYKDQFNSKGIGESLNVECLYYCLDNNIKYVVFIYMDGTAYCISPFAFLSYANTNHTYRKVKTLRKQMNYGKTDYIEETTASIAMKELSNLDRGLK